MNLTRPFNPDKSLNPQKTLLKFVRSENKNQSIWQYLKRYQNQKFVQSRLRTMSPTLSIYYVNKKSLHISESMKQAEAYFEAALKSDLSVRPVILYYGMLNMVKSLIMFADNKHVLDSREMEYHGLNHRAKSNTNDSNIRKDQNNLIDEYCYISSGPSIFKLLHACWSNIDLNASMRFSIHELTSMHPNTWKTLADHKNIIPKLFIAEGGFRTTKSKEHVIKFSPTTQFLIYQKSASEDAWDFLERSIPTLRVNYHRNLNQAFEFVSNMMPICIDEMVPNYKSISGERYTTTEIDALTRTLRIHPIEVEFIIMFILGSLARYAPHKWLKNVQFEGGVDMFILSGILESANYSFPNMILEELDGEEYTFAGNVSYWS